MRLRPLLAFAAMMALGGGAEAACPGGYDKPWLAAIPGDLGDPVIDAACRFLYVPNATGNALEVIALDTGARMTPIPVGKTPVSVDFSVDGGSLYVVNFGDRSVSVVDVAAGRQTRNVTIPYASGSYSQPTSIAAARTGVVLIGSQEQGELMQWVPATDTFTPRNDGSATYLRASGDRAVIGLMSRFGGFTRYYADRDAFGPARGGGYDDLALDRSGARVLSAPYLIDGKNAYAGTIRTNYRQVTRMASAIDGAGKRGYWSTDSGIWVFDLDHLLQVATLQPPDTLTKPSYGARSGIGRMVLSPDGALLAVVTDKGMSIMKTPAISTPSATLVGFSGQSFLRLYNADAAPGAAHVVLADLATGEALGAWDSPAIPPGAAPQFFIGEMEAALPRKAAAYRLTVQTAMRGTLTHVLWHQGDGTLTNLSTCDTGAAVAPDRLANVHSSLFDGGYASRVIYANTGAQAAALRLGVYDARTGAALGVYTLPQQVPSNAGGALPIAVIEAGARIAPSPAVPHYVIKVENAFSGILEHVVDNKQAAVLTDMSVACTLPGP